MPRTARAPLTVTRPNWMRPSTERGLPRPHRVRCRLVRMGDSWLGVVMVMGSTFPGLPGSSENEGGGPLRGRGVVGRLSGRCRDRDVVGTPVAGCAGGG